MKQHFIGLILGGFITLLTLLGYPGSILANPSISLDDIDLCTVPQESLDLNNANLLAFTDCPGFYPNLASAILSHGPYLTVEDVLKIPDLTDLQKALLKANLQSFTVTDPVVPPEKRMPPRLNQPAH